jgi:CheY-like chemotaxis protein
MGENTKKKKVVIVDDDEYVQELLKYLAARGNLCEVLMSNNGAEALKMIEQEMPDLVFVDIMLPHIDGLEICRRLRGKDKTSRIPLVLMTSSRKIRTMSREETGADYLAEKPFDLSEIQAIIEERLKQDK